MSLEEGHFPPFAITLYTMIVRGKINFETGGYNPAWDLGVHDI